VLNASSALAALEALSDRLPVSQQAVREGLLTVEIPARFQVLPGRPTVVLDVAHNPHAAAVLATNLDNMGFFPRTHAVFGMLRDKDVAGVIARLGARIDRWHVGPTPGARGADSTWLATFVRNASGEASEPACRSMQRLPMLTTLRWPRSRSMIDRRVRQLHDGRRSDARPCIRPDQ